MRRLLSCLLLLVPAAGLALLFVSFTDGGSLFRSGPVEPLVVQVEAQMAARSRQHNERNERTLHSAEATIAEFCDGLPVEVTEVHPDDTASIAIGERRHVVSKGIDRRVASDGDDLSGSAAHVVLRDDCEIGERRQPDLAVAGVGLQDLRRFKGVRNDSSPRDSFPACEGGRFASRSGWRE